MHRRVLVLALAALLISTLAAVAALRQTDDAEAQTAAYQMNTICLEVTTGLYKGTFTGNCPPGHRTLALPDSYPLTLCGSYYDSLLRRPQPSGECPPGTRVRIDLPSSTPYAVCYVWATGRLRIPVPYPGGSCGGGAFAVTFPSGFTPTDDTYQTLGNVDIDVPASAGVLANDGGQSTAVTAFDAASANGGTIAMNPDGSFAYTPPAPNPLAFTGDDTFTYTVEDALGDSVTQTVTIQVLGPAVWFVDNDAIDPGDGRRLTPFNNLDVLNNDGSDPDQPGDFIFLYEALDAYETNFLMEGGQSLVGQEVDLGAILVMVIEDTAGLQGSPVTSVPPFLALPPENPGGNLTPLLVGSGGGLPLQMAHDALAAGTFVVSSETAAVSATGVENTTLYRMNVRGGDSTAVTSDGQTGVFLEFSSMAIIESTVRGGNALQFLGSSSTLQGDFGAIFGGAGVETSGSDLAVTASSITGGNAQGAQPLSSGRALQGCCEGSSAGEGIFASGSDVTVADGSTITGGNGDGNGASGGDGIASIGFVPDASLQGLTPEDIGFVSVSGSTVTGGDGGDDADFGFGGDGGAGIFAAATFVDVSAGSTIAGGDGGAGILEGGWAGVGIEWSIVGPFSNVGESALQGPPAEPNAPVISVLDSNVLGGDGGAGTEEFGGFGGEGIYVDLGELLLGSEIDPGSSLAGIEEFPSFILADGATITGGNGGSGGVGGGWGATGIFASTDFLLGSPTDEATLQGPGPTLEVDVIDSNVTGGAGGAGGDDGGLGGDGIIFGSIFSSCPGACERSQVQPGASLQLVLEFDMQLNVIGSTVAGGPGGVGETVSSGTSGSGISNFPFAAISAGIRETGASLQGPPAIDQTSLVVSNSTITGADGVAGGSSADGADGGFGILSLGMAVDIDAGSLIEGGNGGDGGAGGGVSGLGGEGILAIETEVNVSGGSTTTGGDGGAGESLPAPGGDGVLGERTIVTFDGSTAIGGTGGAGIGTAGEDGGHGLHVLDCDVCFTLTVTNATVTGGDGGSSDTDAGGDGGEGILVEGDSADISGSTISGGDAGLGALSGAGAPAVTFVQIDDITQTLVLQTNTLNGGTNGTDRADSLYVLQESSAGTICVSAAGSTALGDFTLENASAGTAILGITQASTAAMSAANNNVIVNELGTITPNCLTAP